MRIAIPVLAALGVAGCGYVGPVLPPTLDRPMPAESMRVQEYGSKIRTEFLLPPLTTEGLPLKAVKSIEVRVGPSGVPFQMEHWAESAKRFPVTPNKPGPLSIDVPITGFAGQEVLISARAVGPKNKAGTWSTPVILMVDAPLAAPTGITAKAVADGVEITWRGAAPKYRIFRAVAAGDPEQVGESAVTRFLDVGTQYETAYRYYVQGFADEKHASEVPPPAAVTPIDTFPPAVPGAVTATLAANTVELAWTRNTEPDFRGYNVYRSVDGGPFERVAEGITSPSYSDSKIEPGKRYRYSITSVDQKGNESEKSTPAEAISQ